MFTLKRASGEVIALVRNRTMFGKDGSACAVLLNHPSASRRHFHVELDATRAALTITDLGSASGTFVNGVRLSEDAPTRLSSKDTITYGTAREDTFTVLILTARNEKMEKALARLAWLQTEIERINSKEGAGGLSENQQRTLERYQADINAIESTIGKYAKETGKSEAHADGGEGEDAFWDSAIANHDVAELEMLDYTEKKQKQSSKEVMTYASLTQKLDDLDHEEAGLNARINALNSKGTAPKEIDEEDELDKFMAANERNIQMSDLEKAQKQLEELGAERKRLEALVEIAKPAIARMSTNTTAIGHIVAPKEPSVAIATESVPENHSAPKPTSAASALFAKTGSSSTAKPKPVLPIKYRVVSDPVAESDKRARHDISEPEKERAKEDPDASWRPPINQRGDGRTAANERFGY